jgi:hypothetical protein
MAAGQWYSPLDASNSSYGNNRTVGCLVYLDDKVSLTTHCFSFSCRPILQFILQSFNIMKYFFFTL